MNQPPKVSIADEEAYRITPLGVLATLMPRELAEQAMKALAETGTMLAGDGLPAIILNSQSGSFIEIQREGK